VTKLFRRNLRRGYSKDVNIDYQHESELPKSRNKQFLHWDNDFPFTTIATCTYTVAIVFLYYLACTLVFLYIPSVRYYIDTTFNIGKRRFFMK